MASSSGTSPQLDNISSAQAQKEVTANAVFDAASPAVIYGRRASTSAALTWGFYGGYVNINGTMTAVTNGTIALTASQTNYVQANPVTGVVSTNITAFTAGYIKLYTIVTGTATVTSYTDWRSFAFANNVPVDTVNATAKTTPVDADLVPLIDSAASNALKSLSWANIKATLLATWKDVTGGLVGMTLYKINFKNAANTFTSFFTNFNTAARTYTFPDYDGTVGIYNAPVTNTTATASVAAGTTFLICNYAGTTTITLPAASTNTSRVLTIKTVTANTVVSNASNVVPIDTATAGTAILAATAGKYAKLVSDGTNWVIMSAN